MVLTNSEYLKELPFGQSQNSNSTSFSNLDRVMEVRIRFYRIFDKVTSRESNRKHP